MSDQSEFNPLLRAEEIQQLPDEAFSHPLNPNSEIHGVSLGDRVGLKRIGFYLARIPPGKESFIYHSHTSEEEFIYILSGRGIAEIDDQEYEVGAGDFMAFPTPSVAHHLRNPFTEDLVYLMGGERTDMEIADFPRLRKRLIRTGNQVQLVDWDQLSSLFDQTAES
jgi:uncharacterized cupin superfamily protein